MGYWGYFHLSGARKVPQEIRINGLQAQKILHLQVIFPIKKKPFNHWNPNFLDFFLEFFFGHSS